MKKITKQNKTEHFNISFFHHYFWNTPLETFFAFFLELLLFMSPVSLFCISHKQINIRFLGFKSNFAFYFLDQKRELTQHTERGKPSRDRRALWKSINFYSPSKVAKEWRNIPFNHMVPTIKKTQEQIENHLFICS